MDAISSLIESALEAFGHRNKRKGRTELSMRVPSLRFRTPGVAWETAPVDLVIVGEHRYLLAPESADTRWAKALAANAESQFLLSSGVYRITAREIDDRDKPPVLREYAKRGSHVARRWRRLGDTDLRMAGREIAVFMVTECDVWVESDDQQGRVMTI